MNYSTLDAFLTLGFLTFVIGTRSTCSGSSGSTAGSGSATFLGLDFVGIV